jgi:hypothetical protein
VRGRAKTEHVRFTESRLAHRHVLLATGGEEFGTGLDIDGVPVEFHLRFREDEVSVEIVGKISAKSFGKWMTPSVAGRAFGLGLRAFRGSPLDRIQRERRKKSKP